MKKLHVTLDRRRNDSYTIHIGETILDRAATVLGKSKTAGHCVVVTDRTIDALHGERVHRALEKSGLRIDRIVLSPGEEVKTIDSVLVVAERLIALGADRQSLLIALGGGVIGDLTGFTASLYMRGIPFIQMPTTLLAQVDSSIGGKTGVDAAGGKNMLGAFYQPKAVFIDTEFLKTLPDAVFRSGFAEVIKYGAMESPALLDDIVRAAAEEGLRDSSFLERIIVESCRIKKSIVELDEREGGLRRILNFGHTVGHAVEAASGYKLSHGESVAIGMHAAVRFSQKLHCLPAQDGEKITSAIRAVGLPTTIPPSIAMDDILARLAMDKKAQHDVHPEGVKTIPFVLIRGLGKPFIQGGIPEKVIAETLEELKG